MNRGAALLCALGLLLPGAARAQESIFDPENPDAPAPEPSGQESISDPENPDAAQASPAPAPPAASLGGAYLQGRWSLRLGMDTQLDRDGEAAYEVHQQAWLRARVPLGPQSSAVVEGLLRHQWLALWTRQGRDTLPGPWDDVDDQVGLYHVELRDAYLSTRLGEGTLLRVGQQRVVWGRTDLIRPADVLNPLDLRGGPGSGGALQPTAPTLMAKLDYIGEHSALQLVLLPFFAPHRFGLLGGDFALARRGAPIWSGLPGLDLLTRLDPSLYEPLEAALVGTRLPDQTPENASGGARVTTQVGGVDVGLGYLLGWDRTPVLKLDPALGELLELSLAPGGLLDGGFSGQDLLRPENLRALELLEEISQRRAQGQALLEASYRRWHVLELDLATYLGPLGLRADVAATPARTFLTQQGGSLRRPSTHAALGLSYEGDQGQVAVIVEGFWLHVFGPAAQARQIAFFGQDLYGAAVALRLDAEPLWGIPVLWQVGGLVDLRGADTALSSELTWRLDGDTRVLGGVQLFTAALRRGDHLRLGTAYDQNDQVYLGLEQGF